MDYIAHVNQDGKMQSCKDHCVNTGVCARDSLSGVGLGELAYLSGLLHDCGKYSDPFQQYLKKAASGEKVARGSVIHTFAGVIKILSEFHGEKERDFYKRTCAELIAYAAGAHHGLFDCFDYNSQNGFIYRLNKQPDLDAVSIKRYLADCMSDRDIQTAFDVSTEELKKVLGEISAIVSDDAEKHNQEVYFYFGLLVRLITSSVIDGDRRDTAEFMNGTDFNEFLDGNVELWDKVLKNLESMIDQFPAYQPIQKARRELSDLCGNAGGIVPGVYRLNLPTGAGKTLSGLRFALTHSIVHSKKRIFYIAPLISILDQNADVIREALQCNEIVLEHHSNVVLDDEEDEIRRHELFAATWDAPVIITTMVQFLNTLFSGKTTCIRRFQSLCNSVIIIDEVQSVPSRMLSLFNLAINFLSKVCHATVLLCSATQPGFEITDHALHIDGNIIDKDDYNKSAPIFKRTEVLDKGNYKLSEIPDVIQSIGMQCSSILVICNKKVEALEIYNSLKGFGDFKYFHLSSSMCVAHRKKLLEDMKRELDLNQKIICISTQVIEAGVDISFSAVVRFAAGMDNVVQAAGRCNRNGESDGLGQVYVVNCTDESLTKLPDIADQKSAAIELLAQFRRIPGDYDNDLTSDASIEYYYKTLYRNMKKGQQDLHIKGSSSSIFELLSDNRQFVASNASSAEYFTRQAFKTAGELFNVFDSAEYSVIVPYQDGKQIIIELGSERALRDPMYRKQLLDKSHDYTVSLFKYQYDVLKDKGVLNYISDGLVLTLNSEYYNLETGLQMDGKEGGNLCDTLIL